VEEGNLLSTTALAVTALTSLSTQEGFHAPGPADFEFPPIFTVGAFEFTKPMLIIVLGTVFIGGLFIAVSRNFALVPGKVQFAAESAYNFVRDGIVPDMIGKEGRKFVPYLATLFLFIAVLNISGIIPFLQLPATSKIGIPLVLAIISWIIYNVVGIRRQGFGGYFKNMMFPPGVPKWLYPLLAPLEFLSTVIIRPITLTLRLSLNMFAGHLVLLLTILGGEYLLFEQGGVLGAVTGTGAILFGILMTFLEAFIQLLQAYIFTLLSAAYIGGAMSEHH
jgi:F-type H+-transporting ATPase subunit a